MSKRKGTFRSKIDSILAEGALEQPEDDGIEPLRSRVDSILAQSGQALTPPEASDHLDRLVTPTSETRLDEIDVSKIRLRPGQREIPRGDTAMDGLKASIGERGIIQPLLLRPAAGGFYEVVDGERRLIAARSLKIMSVPAVVRAISDGDAAASVAAPVRAAAGSKRQPAVAAARKAAPAVAKVAAPEPALVGAAPSSPRATRASAREEAEEARPVVIPPVAENAALRASASVGSTEGDSGPKRPTAAERAAAAAAADEAALEEEERASRGGRPAARAGARPNAAAGGAAVAPAGGRAAAPSTARRVPTVGARTAAIAAKAQAGRRSAVRAAATAPAATAGAKATAAKPAATRAAIKHEAEPAPPKVAAGATTARRAASAAKPAIVDDEPVPTFGGDEGPDDRTIFLPPRGSSAPEAPAAAAAEAWTPVAPAPSGNAVPDFPTVGAGTGRLAAASASSTGQGYTTMVSVIFLVVVALFSFALFSYFVFDEHDLGIRAAVFSFLGLALVGFMLVWRRS